MALIDAVCGGSKLGMIKLLIEGGADVNIQDHNHWSALFYAIKFNRMNICQLLIEKGANVNQCDENGWTPLMIAIVDYKIDIIKLLLIRGANVNIKSNAGWSARDIALRYNSYNFCSILCWRGAKFGKGREINKQIIDIEGLLLLIYRRILPIDLIREIHTKWIS
jgi:ankyrin repeat protein